VRRTYKYLLRPSIPQRAALEGALGLCRELYNGALEEKREAYRKAGKALNCAAQQAELPDVKSLRLEYRAQSGQVLQDVLKRLHRAFDGFFRRVKAGQTPGYPRFKGRDRYDSFTFPQVSRPSKGWLLKNGGVERLSNGRLKVHAIPGELKVKWHRPLAGVPKTATFKREGERWYVLFSCDDVPVEAREKTGRSCGLDVGLEAFATLDDGTRVENPRPLATAWRKVLAAQRRVTRRKQRSNRRRKARRLLAKAHGQVARGRKDFHHKVARKLVRAYDRIAVEQLNILGMARGMLGKQVADAGWAQFLAILKSKAEGAGSEVVEVPAAGTSLACAACGVPVPKTLSERWHRCPDCGFVAHRDVNAALNIRARAFQSNGPGSGPRGDPSAGAPSQDGVGTGR
jgi:putative transposase